MRPKAHIYQGILSTGFLYPFIGTKAFIFGASVILIDLDHVIDYYWYTGKLGIKGFFEYCDFIKNNMDNFLGLNVFHTIECYIILFFTGFLFKDLHYVLMGFLFHHFFDQIQLTIWKKPFARALSIIEFIIRKPYYETSIHDILLRKKNEK